MTNRRQLQSQLVTRVRGASVCATPWRLFLRGRAQAPACTANHDAYVSSILPAVAKFPRFRHSINPSAECCLVTRHELCKKRHPLPVMNGFHAVCKGCWPQGPGFSTKRSHGPYNDARTLQSKLVLNGLSTRATGLHCASGGTGECAHCVAPAATPHNQIGKRRSGALVALASALVGVGRRRLAHHVGAAFVGLGRRLDVRGGIRGVHAVGGGVRRLGLGASLQRGGVCEGGGWALQIPCFRARSMRNQQPVRVCVCTQCSARRQIHSVHVCLNPSAQSTCSSVLPPCSFMRFCWGCEHTGRNSRLVSR